MTNKNTTTANQKPNYHFLFGDLQNCTGPNRLYGTVEAIKTMSSIKKEMIQKAVNYLNEITSNQYHFRVEYAKGGRCRLQGFGANVSEYGTKRETYTFIRTYTEGLALGKGHYEN